MNGIINPNGDSIGTTKPVVETSRNPNVEAKVRASLNKEDERLFSGSGRSAALETAEIAELKAKVRTFGGLSPFTKRRRKRNGDLYRYLKENREFQIFACNDTFQYGEDIGGDGYVTKNELGTNYIPKNPGWEKSNVHLPSAMFY